MKKSQTIALLFSAAIFAPNFAFAQVQDHSGHKSPLGHDPCTNCDIDSLHERSEKPFEYGQDRLAAIQEMVMMLEGKPDTDWSKFNLGAFILHLGDMEEIARNTTVETADLVDGLRFTLGGDVRTMEALARVIPDQNITLGRINGWDSKVQVSDSAVVLTVTSAIPEEVIHIKGLGFLGLMSTGTGHHQPFHLALARGEVEGGWPRAEYIAGFEISEDAAAPKSGEMVHEGAGMMMDSQPMPQEGMMDGQPMQHEGAGMMMDSKSTSTPMHGMQGDQAKMPTEEDMVHAGNADQAAMHGMQMMMGDDEFRGMMMRDHMGEVGAHGMQGMRGNGCMPHGAHDGTHGGGMRGKAGMSHDVHDGTHGVGMRGNMPWEMHGQKSTAEPASGVATLPGQDAFGAIQEIVNILKSDASTDWSKVDISALRAHLVNMNQLVLNAEVSETKIDGGLSIVITGDGRTLSAVQEMVVAHASTIEGYNGWSVIADTTADGATLTVTSEDADEAVLIQGLGFFGIMATGSHHQPHHLGWRAAIACTDFGSIAANRSKRKATSEGGGLPWFVLVPLRMEILPYQVQSRTILPDLPDFMMANPSSKSSTDMRWVMMLLISSPSSSMAIILYHVSKISRP